MNRSAITMLLGCVYLLAASLIVSSQGRAYRDALRRSAEAGTRQDAPSAAVNDEPSVQPVPTRPMKNSASESFAPKAAQPGPIAALAPETRGVPPQPRDVAAPPPPAPGPALDRRFAAAAPATAPPVHGDPTNPVAAGFARATGANAATLRPVTLDPFWERPMAKKKWDVASLSFEDEIRLGSDLHEMVLYFMPRLGSAEAQRRVEAAAKPLLPERKRKEIEYRFFVLDSPAVNAFSHPGGYVYVTRGLLEWISEDELPSLQFVLAHEICHVDERHAIQCLQDPGLRQLPFSTLQLNYLFLIPRGYYPERMDFDADAWALRQLVKLHCTRRECLTFLRRLNGYAEAHNWGLDRAKALPKSGAREALFDNHFRAHPLTYQRLEKLEVLADEATSKSR